MSDEFRRKRKLIKRTNITKLLADEPVAGELVSPCYSLFSPVMFGKSANFPFLWNDLRSTFFQVVSSFPLVTVFSLRCKNCDHSSAKQGYFFNVSGTLDLITGKNSKRLRKRQLRSSPLLSLTLRSATAQGGAGRACVHTRAPQALRAQAPVGKRQKPRIS
jgi:hypothetical protein